MWARVLHPLASLNIANLWLYMAFRAGARKGRNHINTLP